MHRIIYSNLCKAIFFKLDTSCIHIRSSQLWNNNYYKIMRVNEENTYHEHRQYFSLIEKVGSWNHYQFNLFLIFIFINIFDSALMFAPPLLFYLAAYECQDLTSEACTSFVCSLDYADRQQYLSDPPFNSITQQFDVDFQCEFSAMITIFSTLVFVGSIGGMLIFSLFTEKAGRKLSLSLSMVILIFGLFLTILSGQFQSLPMLVGGIIFTYCGCENGYQYVYCFSTEVVTEQWRVSYINLLNVFYGLGIIIDAVAFFYIKQWHYVYIFVFLIPAILTFLAVVFYIEKTPLDLLATESEENILKRLNRIAEINDKEFTLTIQQIQNLKQDYRHSMEKAIHKNFTVIDLFSYNSLRKTIVPLIFLNFTINYLFYSPSTIKGSLSNDLFKDGLIQGFSYCIASVIVHFFLEHMQRRRTIFIITVSTVVFLWLLFIEDHNKDSMIYSVYYFIFRCMVSLGFLVTYLLNYESFPTQIRAVGATVGYLIGNSSGILQPSITQAWKNQGWNVLFLFMGVCMLTFLPNIFLKETFKVPPPEIIEELEEDNQKNEELVKNFE